MGQEYATPTSSQQLDTSSAVSGEAYMSIDPSESMDPIMCAQDQPGAGNGAALALASQQAEAEPDAPVRSRFAQWVMEEDRVHVGLGQANVDGLFPALGEERQRLLSRGMAELTPEQWDEAETRAEQVYAALSRGDEDTLALREALRGLDSPFVGQAVREMFNTRFDVNFDEWLIDQLDEVEQAEVSAWLSGDQVDGALAAIHQDLDGDDDERAIEATLRHLSPEEHADLLARIEAGDPDALAIAEEARADLSGNDLAVFNALFLRADAVEADAVRAYEAVDGAGTDVAALREILARVPEDQRGHFLDEYSERVWEANDLNTNRDFLQELEAEESSYALDELRALASGDPAWASAARYLDALEGLGTEEQVAYDVFDGKTPEERAAIEQALLDHYQLDAAALYALEADEFEDQYDREAMWDERSRGEIDRVTRLQQATESNDLLGIDLGTDEAGVEEAMSGLTAEGVAALGNDYSARTGGELLSDMCSDELGGADLYSCQEAIWYGTDLNALDGDELLSLSSQRHRRQEENQWLTGPLMTLFGSGQTLQQYDLDLARAQDAAARGASDEELRELAMNSVETGELYVGARDEAVKAGGDVAAAVLAVLSAIPTFGSSAPFLFRFIGSLPSVVAPDLIESWALGDDRSLGEAGTEILEDVIETLPGAAIGRSLQAPEKAGPLTSLMHTVVEEIATSAPGDIASNLMNDDIYRGDGDEGLLNTLGETALDLGVNTVAAGMGDVVGKLGGDSELVSDLIGGAVEQGTNVVAPDLIQGRDVQVGWEDLGAVSDWVGGVVEGGFNDQKGRKEEENRHRDEQSWQEYEREQTQRTQEEEGQTWEQRQHAEQTQRQAEEDQMWQTHEDASTPVEEWITHPDLEGADAERLAEAAEQERIDAARAAWEADQERMLQEERARIEEEKKRAFADEAERRRREEEERDRFLEQGGR